MILSRILLEGDDVEIPATLEIDAKRSIVAVSFAEPASRAMQMRVRFKRSELLAMGEEYLKLLAGKTP